MDASSYSKKVSRIYWLKALEESSRVGWPVFRRFHFGATIFDHILYEAFVFALSRLLEPSVWICHVFMLFYCFAFAVLFAIVVDRRCVKLNRRPTFRHGID